MSFPRLASILDHGWRVDTNRLDHLNLVLTCCFPVVHVVVRILLLKTAENRFVFLRDFILLPIAGQLIQSPHRRAAVPDRRHNLAKFLLVLWEVLARTCEDASHALKKDPVLPFDFCASVCLVRNAAYLRSFVPFSASPAGGCMQSARYCRCQALHRAFWTCEFAFLLVTPSTR